MSLFSVVMVYTVSVSAQAVKAHEAGVVKITAEFEGIQKAGSGFIIQLTRNMAYIVTASHVVEGDKSPRVEFSTQRHTAVSASVVQLEGGDDRGIALLLVRGEGNLPPGLSALCMAPAAPLEAREAVEVLGFPRQVQSLVVASGAIVGQDGRELLFSAPVDEGNSGGPVVKEGLVVGLVTRWLAPYGRAIPATAVKFIVEGWGVKPCVGQPAADPEQRAAGQTRVAMLKERQGAEQAEARQRAGRSWEVAEQKAKEGEAAFGRQDYALAKQRFEEARQEYQRAGLTAKTAPGTVQRPQVPKVGDSHVEIHALLDTYKKAFESLDSALYRVVRPSVSEAELRKLKESFAYTRSHTLALTVESINMSADEAEVKGRQKGVQVFKDGQQLPYDKGVTFKVKRAPKGWVIVSINYSIN